MEGDRGLVYLVLHHNWHTGKIFFQIFSTSERIYANDGLLKPGDYAQLIAK